MTEPKFTPGPWVNNQWRIESDLEHGWVNDGWCLAECHGPQAEINAHLIAAAPELYEALETCLLYGAMTGDDWVILKAETALAKARGEV